VFYPVYLRESRINHDPWNKPTGETMLTKMEEQILMTVWRFQGEGYGVNVFRYLEKMNEKRITLGVVYDILERLRMKGYLVTTMGDPTPTRGGMRKKYYEITDAGVEKLIKSKEIHDTIMEGFNELLGHYKKYKRV